MWTQRLLYSQVPSKKLQGVSLKGGMHTKTGFMSGRYFMRKRIISCFFFFVLFNCMACNGKSSNGNAEHAEAALQESLTATPLRAMLNPEELMEVSRSANASELQLYMKEKTGIFFYAKKGEYISLAQGAITDTAGRGLSIPLSTLYFASEPGATWRIAQTLHSPELNDSLLKDFRQKGFEIKDSIRYYGTEALCYRYASPQYPGILLYHSTSIRPWYFKGLYNGSTWMGYVFEIHRENK